MKQCDAITKLFTLYSLLTTWQTSSTNKLDTCVPSRRFWLRILVLLTFCSRRVCIKLKLFITWPSEESRHLGTTASISFAAWCQSPRALLSSVIMCIDVTIGIKHRLVYTRRKTCTWIPVEHFFEWSPPRVSFGGVSSWRIKLNDPKIYALQGWLLFEKTLLNSVDLYECDRFSGIQRHC